MNEPTAEPSRPAPRRPPRAWPAALLATLGVSTSTCLLGMQVTSRDDFASGELGPQVEERWGGPVDQPAPSVRFVESGSIFTALAPLALDRQHVTVSAAMNYRKRGLRSFSGFDFDFTGQYGVSNPRQVPIDVVFVFPIEVDKAQVLLSDLSFLVDGSPAQLELGEARNRLVWTGRLAPGQGREFLIRYRARGLERFLYRLDPALPAHDVRLHVDVTGGENFDYPPGVLSATSVQPGPGSVALDWRFSTLESGVALGAVLPSQQSWDEIIATMSFRAVVPFVGLLALLWGLGVRHRRRLAWYETLLAGAAFAFSFVLVAYLAAFLPFEAAFPVSVLGLGAVFTAWLRGIFPQERWWVLAGLWGATLVLPAAAVVAQGYTGLLYTLELLACLLGALALSTREGVRAYLDDSLFRSAASPAQRSAS